MIRKIEAIVREEVEAMGALECRFPIVQESEIWKMTQRWERYGGEVGTKYIN